MWKGTGRLRFVLRVANIIESVGVNKWILFEIRVGYLELILLIIGFFLGQREHI